MSETASTVAGAVSDRSRHLRAAVIGSGFVGPHHVDAVRRGGIADVAFLVGLEADRTAAMAEALGVPAWSTEADAAISDPSIDVIHVCTPNVMHEPLALAAIEAGKHVVVEKPLAMDLAGATRIRDAAAAAQRHAMVAFTYRGYPQVRRAHDAVAEGRLGETRLVRGAYLQDWLLDPAAWNWRVDPAAGGGSRAVADIGAHWFDTVEYVTGLRIEAVCADLATFIPTRVRAADPGLTFGDATTDGEVVKVLTEDAATILVRFAGGARGSVVVSQVSPGRKNELVIAVDGEAGALEWHQEDPEHLRFGTREGWTIVAREPGGAVPGVPALPGGHPEGWGEAMRDLLRGFYGAIARGDDPLATDAYPTLTAGMRAVAFTEAVLASARSGTWVTLAPTP